MREIKFRALRDDMSDCTFKYGQLFYMIDEMSGRSYPRITQTGKLSYSCLQGTEGQYTGLNDKNGKDIYEGDIVNINHWKSSDLFDYSKPFIVEYYEGEINFKQGEYNNFKGSLGGKIHIEVIGNIHENPELLK